MATEYRIKYEKKAHGNFTSSVVRIIREQNIGSEYMLIDGNTGRNIRPFNDIGEAMTWIDEERRGV